MNSRMSQSSVVDAGKLLPVAAMALSMTAAALLSPSVMAADPEKRWLVRGGITQISPKSDNGTTTAGDVTVDDSFGPSLNIAYYFTPNWAVDVLGAIPFEHDFSVNGVNAGSTDHLPPTVTLQYHFLPTAKVQPFIGLGLNYTDFFDKLMTSGNELNLDPSFGLAAQVGVDIPLNARWLIGADIRYIDIDSDASVDGQDIGTIEIDPLVYSLTLGYRF